MQQGNDFGNNFILTLDTYESIQLVSTNIEAFFCICSFQSGNTVLCFIFQQFQLLPRLDALKNVELPLIYAGVPPRERTRRAEEMLVRVGLKDRMHHYQNQLSGGQQQRVAIARALATNPTLLLADEPTGALDQATGEQVMALFRELNDEGRTIVMITHDLKIARHASRIVNILDGVLSEGVSAYD